MTDIWTMLEAQCAIWDEEEPEEDWWDYQRNHRKAAARGRELEVEVAALKAENERLEKALRDIAFATSDPFASGHALAALPERDPR